MSLSSRTSKIERFREALLQMNSELLMSIQERRRVCLKIQELKSNSGPYPFFNQERELEVFELQKDLFCKLSIKELLSFSLLMEDQAMALAPGSYPSWSGRIHVKNKKDELYEMINPLLLKVTHPEIFNHLDLVSGFEYLKD